jgi:adenine-specific DNA-methyltransferase
MDDQARRGSSPQLDLWPERQSSISPSCSTRGLTGLPDSVDIPQSGPLCSGSEAERKEDPLERDPLDRALDRKTLTSDLPSAEAFLAPEAQKARGAYYTDPLVARFLLAFAVASPKARVLDPCFGEGVFLQAALDRLRTVGSSATKQVAGVEVDAHAYRSIAKVMTSPGKIDPAALHLADFFDLDREQIGVFSAVVGNPPFVRYQRFAGRQRAIALTRALQAGVRLTALTSSWAPFIVHATTFLESEGRIAMVAPSELLHAAYAQPVLDFLGRQFKRVRVLTFARRLFPHLSEDTVLILGEGFGRGPGVIDLVPLQDASALADADPQNLVGVAIRPQASEGKVVRSISFLLPEHTRMLYGHLAEDSQTARFATLATTGIGYVTGNNGFFHLSAREARTYRITDHVLRRAVCRAGWLTGLIFDRRDWMRLSQRGEKTSLLDLSHSQNPLPRPVAAYLRQGVLGKVDRAYKCRVRRPWYVVPHVVVPDLFLAYMANWRPPLVLNRACAVAPNTLLCVRLRPRTGFAPEALAATWWTSLTALSVEVEGHSLGAGLLKLEPGEATKVLFATPAFLRDRIVATGLVRELDQLVRDRMFEQALDLGDREILQGGLGVSAEECSRLRTGFHLLVERRRKR